MLFKKEKKKKKAFSANRGRKEAKTLFPPSPLSYPFPQQSGFRLVLLLDVIINWLKLLPCRDKAPLIVCNDLHLWLLFRSLYLTASAFLTFHSSSLTSF